jgi:hypothetical protein
MAGPPSLAREARQELGRNGRRPESDVAAINGACLHMRVRLSGRITGKHVRMMTKMLDFQ